MSFSFEAAGSQINGSRDYQEDAFLITHLGDPRGGDSASLIVVADGNHSPPHQGALAATCAEDKCRLCLLRNTAFGIQEHLRPDDASGRSQG